jgi:hypothetical protein
LLHLLKLANQRRLYSPLLTSGRLPHCSGTKFLAGVNQMLDEEELHLPDSRHRRHEPADSELLYATRWVLYAKRPFDGPHQSYWLSTHAAPR